MTRAILSRTTHFLRGIVDMGEGQGITLTDVCPHCLRFAAEDYIWWAQVHGHSGKNKKNNVDGGVRHAQG